MATVAISRRGYRSRHPRSPMTGPRRDEAVRSVGPVDGGEGDGAAVLLATGTVMNVVTILETLLTSPGSQLTRLIQFEPEQAGEEQQVSRTLLRNHHVRVGLRIPDADHHARENLHVALLDIPSGFVAEIV